MNSDFQHKYQDFISSLNSINNIPSNEIVNDISCNVECSSLELSTKDVAGNFVTEAVANAINNLESKVNDNVDNSIGEVNDLNKDNEIINKIDSVVDSEEAQELLQELQSNQQMINTKNLLDRELFDKMEDMEINEMDEQLISIEWTENNQITDNFIEEDKTSNDIEIERDNKSIEYEFNRIIKQPELTPVEKENKNKLENYYNEAMEKLMQSKNNDYIKYLNEVDPTALLKEPVNKQLIQTQQMYQDQQIQQLNQMSQVNNQYFQNNNEKNEMFSPTKINAVEKTRQEAEEELRMKRQVEIEKRMRIDEENKKQKQLEKKMKINLGGMNDALEILKKICNYIQKFIIDENYFTWVNNNFYWDMDKIKDELSNNKFKLPSNVSIGIIYKNFEYSSTHKLANKWNNILVNNNVPKQMILQDDNKILKICLENFNKVDKFTKTIGSSTYRFFKRNVPLFKPKMTVQIFLYAQIKHTES